MGQERASMRSSATKMHLEKNNAKSAANSIQSGSTESNTSHNSLNYDGGSPNPTPVAEVAPQTPGKQKKKMIRKVVRKKDGTIISSTLEPAPDNKTTTKAGKGTTESNAKAGTPVVKKKKIVVRRRGSTGNYKDGAPAAPVVAPKGQNKNKTTDALALESAVDKHPSAIGKTTTTATTKGKVVVKKKVAGTTATVASNKTTGTSGSKSSAGSNTKPPSTIQTKPQGDVDASEHSNLNSSNASFSLDNVISSSSGHSNKSKNDIARKGSKNTKLSSGASAGSSKLSVTKEDYGYEDQDYGYESHEPSTGSGGDVNSSKNGTRRRTSVTKYNLDVPQTDDSSSGSVQQFDLGYEKAEPARASAPWMASSSESKRRGSISRNAVPQSDSANSSYRGALEQTAPPHENQTYKGPDSKQNDLMTAMDWVHSSYQALHNGNIGMAKTRLRLALQQLEKLDD